MFKKAFISFLIFAVNFGAFSCLCAHEKQVKTVASRSCHEQSNETRSQNSDSTSKSCCCIDKHIVSEAPEVFVFNSAHAIAHVSIVRIALESFSPVLVTFKLDRNFHPPTNKLPIYFSKHSFLI